MSASMVDHVVVSCCTPTNCVSYSSAVSVPLSMSAVRICADSFTAASILSM